MVSSPPFSATVPVTVTCAGVDPERCRQAAALATELGLPLAPAIVQGSGLWLVVSPDGLELRQAGRSAPGPVRVDFVSGPVAHRRRFGGGRGQPLARAVGLRQGRSPRVLDATAGLGRDAFVLATLGAEVALVERSPVIRALLRDGLERAAVVPELAPIVARMDLIGGDARDILQSMADHEAPEVIYLDPMYPERRKKALVKKEMRLFRLLAGDDADAGELLRLARRRARYRVVVKRPARGEHLAGMTPDASVRSPNTRYDLYVNRGME